MLSNGRTLLWGEIHPWKLPYISSEIVTRLPMQHTPTPYIACEIMLVLCDIMLYILSKHSLLRWQALYTFLYAKTKCYSLQTNWCSVWHIMRFSDSVMEYMLEYVVCYYYLTSDIKKLWMTFYLRRACFMHAPEVPDEPTFTVFHIWENVSLLQSRASII